MLALMTAVLVMVVPTVSASTVTVMRKVALTWEAKSLTDHIAPS